MAQVRTRMAPSPTGYFHVGSARTALYNWLYARQHGGVFVLRIEDTDRERSTQASVDVILESMHWMGLEWDEGPIYQSTHLPHHTEVAEKLLAEGQAYRCYATTEEIGRVRDEAKAKGIPSWKYNGPDCVISLDEQAARAAAGAPSVVRFRVPRGGEPVVFTDLIYGENVVSGDELDDFVLLRNDGSPLYMLSVVCDDIDAGITHIIRGADHLSNTPKQLLLYQAIGAPAPQFGHMSLIMAPDGSKLSKRKHGDAVSITNYRDRGFLPEALNQFLATVGYGSGESEADELLDAQALIDRFDLTRVGRANAKFTFDPTNPKQWTDAKAQSLNAAWVRTMPLHLLQPYVRERLQAAGLWDDSFAGDRAQWFGEVLELIRQRYWTLLDFVEQGSAYFSDTVNFDPAAVKKNLLKDPRLATLLPALGERLAALADFDHDSIEAAVRALAEEQGVGAGLLINGLRTAVTGQAVGPGAFELCVAIGRERVVDRLRRAPEISGA